MQIGLDFGTTTTVASVFDGANNSSNASRPIRRDAHGHALGAAP